jgi:ATP-dependent exoDNAse (exonuclease V) alpha subunit
MLLERRKVLQALPLLTTVSLLIMIEVSRMLTLNVHRRLDSRRYSQILFNITRVVADLHNLLQQSSSHTPLHLN